jgi:hypothetical protein
MISQSMIRTDMGNQTFLGLGEVLKGSAVRDFVNARVQPFLAAAA